MHFSRILLNTAYLLECKLSHPGWYVLEHHGVDKSCRQIEATQNLLLFLLMKNIVLVASTKFTSKVSEQNVF